MYKTISKEYMGVAYLEFTRLNSDNSTTSFPSDPANTDYQTYLAWLAEGNTPLPADSTP